MSLAAGVRLGPYEILSPLGAGGMGEVYRAHDARLDRDVAVKILPSHLADDPIALARFEREAKAVAATSHPNILSIHDFGRQDGTVYAVMELLDGESLRERLGSGALSWRKTADYALQIAHGLAAAHEKGIVHRDLKPENLFVTRDGRVKILDFGIARHGPLSREDTQSPTVTRQTEPGTLLGTVGYMSPEQVRGVPTDNRSDIFSFGCVLYEMVTGHRAFHRGTAAETMTAILKEDPPEISAAKRGVPASLERIVRHCLEKAPAERFQSVPDLAFDLQVLSLASDSGAARHEAFRIPLTRRVARGLAGAALLLVAVMAGLLAGRQVWRAPMPSLKRLTFARGAIGEARFASDGKTVIYGARWQGRPPEVFVVHAESPESRPQGFANASLLSVSRSDELLIQRSPHLNFGVFHGTLARAPLGTPPRDLLEEIQDADWTADGKDLAILRITEANHSVIEWPPGHVLLDSPHGVDNLRLSPTGDRIAFFESLGSAGEHGVAADLSLVDPSGKKIVLTRARHPAGLAWGSAGDVWFAEVSERGETSLSAVELSGRVRLVWRAGGRLALKDIARDGSALVTLFQIRRGIMARPPGSASEIDFSWLDGSEAADISRDGRTLLFNETAAGGGETQSFYVRGMDGSPAIRLGEGTASALSADGRLVLARSPGRPRNEILLVTTGAGESRRVSLPGIERSVWFWFTPDGRRIVFTASNGGAHRFFIMDLDEGHPRPITPEGVMNYAWQQGLSPDGRFVAGSNRWVYPVDGGDPRPVPGIEPWEALMCWSADSRALYVLQREGLPARVHRVDIATGRRELWKDLMPADPAGIDGIEALKMTPDGRAYAYNFTRVLADLYRVEGLK
jgi:eukaryotic-like serine/threonine-protein kinase